MLAQVFSFVAKMGADLLLILCLTIAAVAQSGRVVAASPTPPIQTPASPVAEVPNAASTCENEVEEIKYIPPAKVSEFIRELNRLGKCGYRLEKADKAPFGPGQSFERLFIFAVVRRYQGDRYEYEWFEAMSPGELQTRIKFRAENGYSLRKVLLADTIACLGDASSGANGSGMIAAGGIFIVERKNGIEKRNDYRVLDGIVGDDKFMAENQKKLNDAVAEGYRPVAINYAGYLTGFVVLVEKDADIKPEGEYLLVRHVYGISKKFTKLSREGYSPIFVGLSFAVLHRTSTAPQNVSYFSYDSFSTVKKKISKFPNAYLKTKGLSLLTCYTPESKLYFGQLPEGSPRYEYKFLEIKNYRLFKDEGGALHESFTEPPPAEALQEFRRLLSEGYVVRDVLEWQNAYVIFERALQRPVF